GGTPGTAPGTPVPPAAATPAPTYAYRSVIQPNTTSLEAFKAELDKLGQEGYRLLLRRPFKSNGQQPVSLMVKDAPHVYDYRLLEQKIENTEKLAQLDEQGALGYRYLGDMLFTQEGVNQGDKHQEHVSVFIRNQNQAGHYQYHFMPLNGTEDRQAFTTAANTLGEKGYWLMSGELGLGYPGTAALIQSTRIFVKDLSATSRYQYRIVDGIKDRQALLQQLDTQGSEGYRYSDQLSLKSADGPQAKPLDHLYVRDESQPQARFSYRVDDVHDTPAPYVDYLNTLGKQHYSLLRYQDNRDIHIQASNCTGPICAASDLL
ncbi:MAG: hypothetical protein Q4E06_10965, partial [Lautropia sp.]|nr:hypothetical protein [Lautropia sp.]